MIIANVSDAKLKNALKAALVETLQEKPALFHDVFAEVLEDYALGAAIREGLRSKPSSRSEVNRALRGGR